MKIHLAHLGSERVAFVGDWPDCARPPELAADHPLARALYLQASEVSRPAASADTELRAVALRALDDPPIFRLRPGSRTREMDAPTLARTLLDEIDAGEWSLAPPIAFNHLAATRQLALVGESIDVVRLGAGLVPTRALEPDAERLLDEWLDEHGRGYECGRAGCAECRSFEPLAAEMLRLFALLSTVTAIERRFPGCLAKAGLQKALVAIARGERRWLTRHVAEAAVKLAGEPVDPGRSSATTRRRPRACGNSRSSATRSIRRSTRSRAWSTARSRGRRCARRASSSSMTSRRTRSGCSRSSGASRR